MKTFVFGIDGGTLEIIKKIGEDKLPNLYGQMKKGSYGKLISTDPPHTAPGWASAVTGVSPGKHGIYQFWNTQSADFLNEFVGADDFGVDTLWDILNDHQVTTGMVNIPMSYPPHNVSGYMISWPLVKTFRYSYPTSLLKEIISVNGHYLPDIYNMFVGDFGYIEEAISIINKRVKTLKYLMNTYPQDFVMAVFPEVDRVSHYYWNYMDESSPCYEENKELLNAIERVYIETDIALGTLLSELSEECMVIVLSDHGFGCGNLDFHIHNFLHDNGLLNIKEAPEDSLVDGCVVFLINDNKYTIDWSKTKAYIASPGAYGVNINLKGRQQHGIVEKEDFDRVCNEIITALRSMKQPDDKLLFERVVKSSEVYHGEKLDMAPDIMLIPYDYGTMVQHTFSDRGLFSKPEQKGMHRKEGMYIISGKNIRSGYNHDANIMDITPTILQHYQISIPEYMEGNIMPIFGNEYLEKNKVKTISYINNRLERETHELSEDEKSQVKRRLKALGYL